MNSEKNEFIETYFASWEERLDRAKILIDLENYSYEGILVLCCYIGAFSSMRYPELQNGVAFKKTLLQYSNMKDFYEQIDLLFLYQWPRSIFRDNGNYKDLKNYQEIIGLLKNLYGEEKDLVKTNRFVLQQEVIDCILKGSTISIDEENLKERLPLFSLAEILYRYVRCSAVHCATLEFINSTMCKDDAEEYILTSKLLWETTLNIKNSLWRECIKSSKWPHELGM